MKERIMHNLSGISRQVLKRYTGSSLHFLMRPGSGNTTAAKTSFHHHSKNASMVRMLFKIPLNIRNIVYEYTPGKKNYSLRQKPADAGIVINEYKAKRNNLKINLMLFNNANPMNI